MQAPNAKTRFVPQLPSVRPTFAAVGAAAVLTAISGCRSRPYNDDSATKDVPGIRHALFESQTPVTFTLSAPFEEISRTRFETTPDGKEKEFEGALTYRAASGEASIPAKVRVRGRNSKDECRFPKLRMKLDKAKIAGTPFEGLDDYKIASHCDKDPAKETKVLGDARAVAREHTLLRIWQAVGKEMHVKSRLAKVKYVDSKTGKVVADTDAFLFEDGGDVVKRIGGKEWKRPEDVSSSYYLKHGIFEARWVVLNHLFQAFAGNGDWAIFDSNMGELGDIYNFFNVLGVELEDGRVIPMPQDLDLARLVAARGKEAGSTSGMSSEMWKGKDPHFREIAWQVSRVRGRYPFPERLAWATSRIKTNAAAVEALIKESPLDAPARELFLQRWRFLVELMDDKNLFAPPMTKGDAILTNAADGKTALCSVKAGTPLAILGKDDRTARTQVRLLDVTDEPSPCTTPPGSQMGAKQGWIETRLVGMRYPSTGETAGFDSIKLKAKNAAVAKIADWAQSSDLPEELEKCAVPVGTLVTLEETVVRNNHYNGKIRGMKTILPGCRLPGGAGSLFMAHWDVVK